MTRYFGFFLLFKDNENLTNALGYLRNICIYTLKKLSNIVIAIFNLPCGWNITTLNRGPPQETLVLERVTSLALL
jgi:hypothetical protein